MGASATLVAHNRLQVTRIPIRDSSTPAPMNVEASRAASSPDPRSTMSTWSRARDVNRDTIPKASDHMELPAVLV